MNVPNLRNVLDQVQNKGFNFPHYVKTLYRSKYFHSIIVNHFYEVNGKERHQVVRVTAIEKGKKWYVTSVTPYNKK